MAAEYRLYYNDDGTLFCYSMEVLPDKKFLVVDAEIYSEAPTQIKIIEDKIVRLKRTGITCVYEKNKTGIQTSKYDINILVTKKPANYWSLKTHDISNNTDTRT